MQINNDVTITCPEELTIPIISIVNLSVTNLSVILEDRSNICCGISCMYKRQKNTNGLWMIFWNVWCQREVKSWQWLPKAPCSSHHFSTTELHMTRRHSRTLTTFYCIARNFIKHKFSWTPPPPPPQSHKVVISDHTPQNAKNSAFTWVSKLW